MRLEDMARDDLRAPRIVDMMLSRTYELIGYDIFGGMPAVRAYIGTPLSDVQAENLGRAREGRVAVVRPGVIGLYSITAEITSTEEIRSALAGRAAINKVRVGHPKGGRLYQARPRSSVASPGRTFGRS